ncbi:MAG: hypothetical protein QXU18_08430 [Thermoplasmatales archaeon]
MNNKNAHFSYKLHTIQDAYNDTIINYSTAKATFHYSQIDLSIPGIICYKDKGYSGAGRSGINATMDKSSHGSQTPHGKHLLLCENNEEAINGLMTLFCSKSTIPRMSCLRCHNTRDNGQEHVSVSGTKSYVHDQDEK